MRQMTVVNVRFGSLAATAAEGDRVRVTPESGHSLRTSEPDLIHQTSRRQLIRRSQSDGAVLCAKPRFIHLRLTNPHHAVIHPTINPATSVSKIRPIASR